VSGASDLALRITVPRAAAEVVGAVLMERLGPFAEEPLDLEAAACEACDCEIGDFVTLVFYPRVDEVPTDADILAALPGEVLTSGRIRFERRAVPRDWVDGWKDHFHPIIIGGVRVRPPWEPALESVAGGAAQPGGAARSAALVDVVINPGLGFGTGLHPTTRGALTLLQDEPAGSEVDAGAAGTRGALVDAGTGSGILSIAAAKLGWGPILAFDNDGVALVSTRENMVENGVDQQVQVHECGVAEAPLSWFAGKTVVANMTLDPVLVLVRRLANARPSRLVVAGILAGAQEEEVVLEAAGWGFVAGRRVYETEWVSMELLPGAEA
jgi:ribosomal protein L11 methyltransferase